MDIMDTNPIPFSWMTADGDDYHSVFDCASPEKREIYVWLNGWWMDALDTQEKDILINGKPFSIYVDPDDDDKFIARLVKGLI